MKRAYLSQDAVFYESVADYASALGRDVVVVAAALLVLVVAVTVAAAGIVRVKASRLKYQCIQMLRRVGC